MFEYIHFLLRTRVRANIIILVIFLIVSITWRIFILSIPEESITFLDVGQGDAMFIQLKTGEQIIVDTGPGIEILYHLGSLMPPLDTTIESIFISHLHADHIGGLAYIGSRYNIEKLYVNLCQDGEITGDFGKYSNIINTFYQKQVIIGEGFVARSLWPDGSLCSQTGVDENYLSQILEIHVGNTSILLTGDAEFGVEAPITYTFDLPDVDIIKVPHHGSKHAITTDFLSRTSPSIAIITVGDNSFGHPSKDILDLLIQTNTKYYRTDIQGNIKFLIHNNGYTIRTGDQP